MSKATCTRCGYVAKLEGESPQGNEFWKIPDAIKFLIDKIKNHKCVKK